MHRFLNLIITPKPSSSQHDGSAPELVHSYPRKKMNRTLWADGWDMNFFFAGEAVCRHSEDYLCFQAHIDRTMFLPRWRYAPETLLLRRNTVPRRVWKSAHESSCLSTQRAILENLHNYADPTLTLNSLTRTSIEMRQLSRILASARPTFSSVTEVLGRPERSSLRIEVRPVLNASTHSCTFLLLSHASPYWCSILQWISLRPQKSNDCRLLLSSANS